MVSDYLLMVLPTGGIKAVMEEPQPSEPSLLLQDYCRPSLPGPSSCRCHRRSCDLYPTFDIEREYTFEFFQQQGDVLALAV
jgi:hypothetical protein